jgi:hypothetical protein
MIEKASKTSIVRERLIMTWVAVGRLQRMTKLQPLDKAL